MEESDLSARETLRDALPNVGQSMKKTDAPSEVTSPHKPNLMAQVQDTSPKQKIVQMANKSQKGKGWMKKIAREKGLSQTQVAKAQNQVIGIKRLGSLIFLESEGSDARKKLCEGLKGNSNAEDLSAAAAVQRRREP